MNPLFLLKLISDLIKDDKPTVEQVKCARTIVDNLIKEYDDKDIPNIISEESDLSPEAFQAQRELQ